MRILCLHGMGTNSKIFEIQTAKIRLLLGGNHEYIFVDGSVETDPAPGVKKFAAIGDEFLCYAMEGQVEGYLQAYWDLKEFVSNEEPFDGIMAFSEGAAAAAALVVDHTRRKSAYEQSPFGFKFGIFFCSANPVDPDAIKGSELIFMTQKRDGAVVEIPTAHIWTRDDNVHPGFGQGLRGICRQDVMEEFVHDLGHNIPGAQSDAGVFETVRAIRRTIERAVELDLDL